MSPVHPTEAPPAMLQMGQYLQSLSRRGFGLQWYRRLRFFLLVFACCGLTATAVWLSRPNPVVRFQTYVGRDLRELSDAERIEFDGLVDRLVPNVRTLLHPHPPRSVDPRDWFDYVTAKSFEFPPRQFWHLWRVNSAESRPRLVLFQASPLIMLPGNSSARVFVLDLDGRLLTDCEFLTGYRIDIVDADWQEDSGHDFPCLVVRSAASLRGADIAYQYYALLEDKPALIRLEDSQGSLLQINYYNKDHTIGPPAPQRTAEQWEAAIHSSDPAEVLRTLVWLGGNHADQPLRKAGIEEFEDASRVRETRGHPGVLAAVETLTKSQDPWVREAAHLASAAIQEARESHNGNP